jgi:hypothetical protein
MSTHNDDPDSDAVEQESRDVWLKHTEKKAAEAQREFVESVKDPLPTACEVFPNGTGRCGVCKGCQEYAATKKYLAECQEYATTKKYLVESTAGSQPFTFAKDSIEHGISIKAPEKVFPDANKRQVGGTHYGLSPRQHWDIVVEFDLDYFQAQITKYVMRWDKKNGLQDLEKAQHFLEKYIEEIQAGRIRKGQEAKV